MLSLAQSDPACNVRQIGAGAHVANDQVAFRKRQITSRHALRLDLQDINPLI